MYSDKLLFWISFVYYLTSIYSIIVAFWLFQEGDISFFITFSCIFLIDKIATLFFMIGSKTKMVFWVCDIFQIGFVYIFLVEKFFEDVVSSLVLKIPSRLVPQIILEFIFFFCLGTLKNDSISIHAQFAAFSNFLVFLTLLFSFSSIVSLKNGGYQQLRKKIVVIYNYIISTATFYITLCTLTFYKDNFGINLGYYQFLIIIINQVGYLILKYPKVFWREERWIKQFIVFSLTNIFLNKFSFTQEYVEWKLSKTLGYSYIITYLSQLSRVILIIVFGYQEFPNYQLAGQNTFKLIFTYLTFSLSLIYFVHYFKYFYRHLFKYKIVYIHKEEDIQRAIDILKNGNYDKVYVKTYKAGFGYPYQQQLIQNNKKYKKEVLELVQLLGNYDKQGKLTSLKQEYNYFLDYYEDILVNIEHIYEWFMDQIVYQYRGKQYQIFMAISQRIENGFGFTPTTQLMFIYAYPKKILQEMNSSILQIILFSKMLSNKMTFSPQQILYDLYQSN